MRQAGEVVLPGRATGRQCRGLSAQADGDAGEPEKSDSDTEPLVPGDERDAIRSCGNLINGESHEIDGNNNPCHEPVQGDRWLSVAGRSCHEETLVVLNGNAPA